MPQREEFEKQGQGKGHAYGAASITYALEGADFPCSKRQLINEFGDKVIHWTKDHPEKVRELLQKLPQENFESMADVVEALTKVLHTAAEKAKTR